MDNPPPVLILEFRHRKVSVVRSQWLSYDAVLRLAVSTFPSLRNTPLENIVLLTTISAYSDHGDVEVSKESWDVLRTSVSAVTIVFRHERLALENQT